MTVGGASSPTTWGEAAEVEPAPFGAPLPLIQVDALAKSYTIGEIVVEALRGVSFEIASGEYVAIMGPSGGGKSTLLNLLGCLDRPTSGSYRLGGDEVAQLSQNELAEVRLDRVGFVFQTFNLLPRLTALENIELPLRYARVTPAKRRVRSLEALAAVGLADRARHLPTQLSGGQQQRVAIARALVNGPQVILADEPTGNLDSASAEEVLSILRELNDSGATIVIVTHEADVARHASRVLRIRDGLVERDERVAPLVLAGTAP